ncbi:MmcQ/YjbR family DNA-binding protein [Blastococcus sp. KM273129]|uniref:MmcQ/YjbR family DNA-binding protein n=1 Tax=Blastococcus sp. KM273129 TaxID=2570315 RepID=UPI001F16B6C3|nr:MmcQ/YjbR family DNA-binding protein [Blastococcus sp. KM273129]MCF6735179.1 MmcQ/YjbR family DNA-binding protein [Blastococcus sp. KM273129]
MATWDDVRRLVSGLPETDEHPSYGGHPSWRVRGKAFVWARPLRQGERAALGDAAPDEEEPLLGVRVADEGEKAALLASAPAAFLTTPHFAGYPVVLVRLERIPAGELAELVEEAWRTRAPRRLVADVDGRRGPT